MTGPEVPWVVAIGVTLVVTCGPDLVDARLNHTVVRHLSSVPGPPGGCLDCCREVHELRGAGRKVRGMPWFGHLARLEPPNGAVEEPPWLRAVQDSRGCGVWDGDAAGAVSVHVSAAGAAGHGCPVPGSCPAWMAWSVVGTFRSSHPSPERSLVGPAGAHVSLRGGATRATCQRGGLARRPVRVGA